MVPNKLTNWLGKPVETWTPANGAPDYANKIYRLEYDWDEEVPVEKSLPAFLDGAGVEETTGLSLGMPYDTAEDLPALINQLIEKKAKLPKLRGLFLGEMEQEDCELSWIEQGDIGPVLAAFPALEDLRVRGGTGLKWTSSRHICLKKLIIETGGMPKVVLEGLLNSVFPELEHLELWLGTDEYGWDGTAEDVKPFLYDNPFPKLTHLGLRNCIHETEIAQLAANAPVLDQLETLDLSLGTLQDPGGEALLASEKVKQLKKLDLHYHFMSDANVRRFQDSGLDVDVSQQEQADEYDGETYYYVSVGE